jgi:putative MATE family efflux protein
MEGIMSTTIDTIVARGAAAPAATPPKVGGVGLTPRTRAILENPILPTLFRLATPTLVVILVQSAVSVVETYFVGWLGSEALAGVALVFPAYMLMQTMAGGGIASGVTSAIARALGGGRRDDAQALAFHAIVIAVAFGVAFAVVELLVGRVLFRAMGGDGAALDAAVLYGAILFGGAVLCWLFNTLVAIVRGTGVFVVPATISVTGAVITVGLSPALIFGVGPIPGFGVAGAAIATLVYYAGASAALGIYLVSARSPLPLSFRRQPQGRLFRDILRVGLPATINTVVTNTTVLILTGLVGPFGTTAIAGYGIGARLEYLQIPIVLGFGGALVTMVGTNIGAGKKARAERIAWTGAAVAGGITGVIGLSAAIDPYIWINIFSSDPSVVAAGAGYLRIVAPTYAFYGVALALYFAAAGAGRPYWPLMVSCGRLVVAVGGGAIAVYLGGGLSALYVAMAASLLFTGVGNMAAVGLGAWRR